MYYGTTYAAKRHMLLAQYQVNSCARHIRHLLCLTPNPLALKSVSHILYNKVASLNQTPAGPSALHHLKSLQISYSLLLSNSAMLLETAWNLLVSPNQKLPNSILTTFWSTHQPSIFQSFSTKSHTLKSLYSISEHRLEK